MGFSARCGEADYFPPQTQRWSRQLDNGTAGLRSLSRQVWECSSCFLSPNPEGEKRRLRMPQNHTGTWKNDPPPPRWVRATWQAFAPRNTFFSAKGEDFIKLKVEGHSRAAAAATLGEVGSGGRNSSLTAPLPQKGEAPWLWAPANLGS